MLGIVDTLKTIDTSGLGDLLLLVLIPLYMKLRDICREQDHIVKDMEEIKAGIKRLEGLHLDDNRFVDVGKG